MTGVPVALVVLFGAEAVAGGRSLAAPLPPPPIVLAAGAGAEAAAEGGHPTAIGPAERATGVADPVAAGAGDGAASEREAGAGRRERSGLLEPRMDGIPAVGCIGLRKSLAQAQAERRALEARIAAARKALAAERAALDEKARTLAAERAALDREIAAFEHRRAAAASGEGDEGTAAQAEAAPRPAAKAAPSEAEVVRVARLLQGMKARVAAKVVARLDPALTLDVLRRMSNRQASGILAALPPEQAASITTALARGGTP